ncbi:DMT family transporter [Kamptonema formosum]|uniref:DMT family transporter n=1 Tax=Kamptonema formosum TaxID=331992 RepID=UPI00034AEF8D|nr:multidrug efflux SMR transporter [Oscillatoria sp. PCC 10802]
MRWIPLILAILLEVAGTTCMKFSKGFTEIFPSILMALFYVLSLSSLTIALKRIDLSVAYAIWSGLGTALIAILGILWFKEPANTLKIMSIGLIIIGVIGLNLSGGTH